MKKNMNIVFSSALTDIVEKNPSFDAGKLRVAYTGKNRNNTFISKEAFERAVPSMFNVPVVANYMREENEIGSHDGEWIEDKAGEVKYINLTQPVGIVPESAQWYWEDIEDHGVVHQYFCTDVILWKRQEAYQKIKDNGITEQSMEIEVQNGEMLDDYYNIKDFCFTAFCLLGTAEPCFESAALFTFEHKEEFQQQYTEMLKEFKLAFASADETDKKEGKESLKLNELLEKYSVSESDLNFEIEGLSDEELEAKFAEVFESEADEVEEVEEKDVEDEIDEPDTSDDSDVEPDENPDAEEFGLNSQLADNLRKAIGSEKYEDDWGYTCSRRFMIDYDTDASEVYFWDCEDGNMYGCKYTLDGDDVVIDFANAKRKKYAIVDYVEGSTQEFNLKEVLNAFSEKYAVAAVDQKELARLKEFEQKTLAAAREADEAELFGKFEDKLKDNEEFVSLKEKSAEFTLEDLEKELFALVGKVEFALAKDSKPQNKPGFGFEDTRKNDSMRALFAGIGKDKED